MNEKKNYEKKNYEMDLLATKLNAKEADAFRALAAKNRTTVSRMLSNYVRSAINGETGELVREPNPTGTNAAVLTYKNVDRLKHETAFHNPHLFSPDEMLNHILNNYFKMVEEVRKTT